MGAVEVTRSFSSSDWERTLGKLQEQAMRYYRDKNGNMVEDCDYNNYSGDINTIYNWKFVKMNDASENQIWNYLRSNMYYPNVDTGDGIVVEGITVGYDLYTPTFMKLKYLPEYKKYINLRRGEYSVLKQTELGIRVVYAGDLEACKEYVSTELYYETDKIYVICGNRGNHYKCYNLIKRVKSTSRENEVGKLKIKEVHNYYCAGMAHC